MTLTDQLERLSRLRDTGYLQSETYDVAVDLVLEDPDKNLVNQIERLAELRGGEKLSDIQYHTALNRLLGGSHTAEPSAVAAPRQITANLTTHGANVTGCLHCGHPEPLGARFCTSCGAVLVSSCPLCGEDNPRDAEYCRVCGARRDQVTPGLLLREANEWARIFNDVGWNDSPEGALSGLDPSAKERLAKEFSDLPLDSADHTSVFCSLVSTADWKIGTLAISKVGASEVSGRVGRSYLIATRCALIVFEPGSALVRPLFFKDVVSVSSDRHRFCIKFIQGTTLNFSVNARGPKFIDHARFQYWRGKDNTLERLVAASAVQGKRDEQYAFLDLVRGFVSRIEEIGRDNARAIGVPVDGDVEWEYHDLLIQLDVEETQRVGRILGWNTKAVTEVIRRVKQGLAEAASEGWEPFTYTDFFWLKHTNAIKTEQNKESSAVLYKSVTVRVRRPRRQAVGQIQHES